MKGYKTIHGDTIENVLSDGVQHFEFVIADSATKIPDPPQGAKLVMFDNDSGAEVRYGSSTVTMAGATRGFRLMDGKQIAFGITEDFKDVSAYFVSAVADTKIVGLWGF